MITTDRFVFLLCLVAPFRHWRSLLVLILVLSGLQVLTLTATAQGAVATTRWLAELSDLGLAATVVLFAIGNLAVPNLRRRWFLSAVVGSLGGFGLGALLADAWQFAGTETVISLVSFNIGVVLVELAGAALAFAAVRLLFARVLGPPLGVVVLSAVLGHAAWHWMIDRGHQFGHELDHGLDVANAGQVRQRHRLAGEQARGEDRQRAVLVARGADVAGQRPAALDHEGLHQGV